MKVEVQLFATLAAYLPAGASGDTVTLAVPNGTTATELVRSLGIPGDLECLMVVNGHDVSPGHRLTDGDVLSLFPPLAGG